MAWTQTVICEISNVMFDSHQFLKKGFGSPAAHTVADPGGKGAMVPLAL